MKTENLNVKITHAEMPESLSQKAKLGWEYMFGKNSRWIIIETFNEDFIAFDRYYSLNDANIYRGIDDLNCCMEDIVNQCVENDAKEFFKELGVSESLLTEAYIELMIKTINE